VCITRWRHGSQSVEQVKQKLLSAIQQQKYQVEAQKEFGLGNTEGLTTAVESHGRKPLLPLHRAGGVVFISARTHS